MLKDTKIKSPTFSGTQFPIQDVDFRARLEEFDEALKVRKIKETLTLCIRSLHRSESIVQG